MKFGSIMRSLRLQQWTKNAFVFAGIIFSLKFHETVLLLKVGYAFLIFCFLSSSIYLINDLRDQKADQCHPLKKLRPIASGELNKTFALILAFVLAVCSLWAAFYLDRPFALVALSYFLLMLVYNFFLKNIVLLDVFSIAGGFVLRAVAGVVVIGVVLSPWLVICTILLSLFIGLGKRRHELLTLDTAIEHRSILREYNPQLLDQLISMVAGSTVMAYALYTLWPETVMNFGTKNLIFTIPFVLYGIFRYMYLIYKKEKGGSPEKILFSDLPLFLDIVLWVISVLMIFLFRF